MHAPLHKWGGMQWKVEIGTKCQTDAVEGENYRNRNEVSFVRCMGCLSRNFFQSHSYHNTVVLIVWADSLLDDFHCEEPPNQ